MAALAAELETQARKGMLEGSPALLSELEHELDLAGYALKAERAHLQALSVSEH